MYYPTSPKLNFATMSKVTSMIISALLITFLLFVLMDKLTRMEQASIRPTTTTVIIDPVFREQDRPIIERGPIKPPPVRKQPPKSIQQKVVAEPSGDSKPNMGDYVMVKPVNENTFKNMLGLTAGLARPIVRVEPKYPVEAAREGIQGWVKLSFTIASSGQVTDIQVLDAEPKRTFDREAKRALSKWKYQPQIIDGKAVPQDNMLVVLDFKLSAG